MEGQGGPVQITGNVAIVADERVILPHASCTSISEFMAVLDSQLSTYWLPWYDRVNVNSQLRFGLPQRGLGLTILDFGLKLL